MMMNRTIWLARHGNRQDFVDANWRSTADRPFDPGLSPDGVQQAKELGQRLKSEAITKLFASPFLRTVETAFYVAEALDLEICVEAGLSEYLNPAWFSVAPQHLTLEQLSDRFPRINFDYTSRLHPTFPETGEQAMHRSGAAARLLAEEFAHEEILLVGHGASVSGATRGLVGTTAKVNCALCCLVKLVHEGDRWTMELNGDVSHLSSSEVTLRFN